MIWRPLVGIFFSTCWTEVKISRIFRFSCLETSRRRFDRRRRSPDVVDVVDTGDGGTDVRRALMKLAQVVGWWAREAATTTATATKPATATATATTQPRGTRARTTRPLATNRCLKRWNRKINCSTVSDFFFSGSQPMGTGPLTLDPKPAGYRLVPRILQLRRSRQQGTKRARWNVAQDF